MEHDNVIRSMKNEYDNMISALRQEIHLADQSKQRTESEMKRMKDIVGK